MQGEEIIERIFKENQALHDLLLSQNEISLASMVGDQFRKTLLLAIASQFEHRVTSTVRVYSIAASFGDDALTSFVKAKGITRQYHTYFKWDASNGNTFFGLFGNSFKSFMTKRLEERNELQEGLVAFLTLGELRNQLVHNDYATFTLDKTPIEIYDLYRQAVVFVRALGELFDEHSRSAAKATS
jgi:hypothetical protein